MCIMKRVFILLFSIVSLLCATDAYSQRSIELGYSKHIFRSKTGAGYIPFLNDMGYNGMYVAFRYNMFFSDAPDSRFAAQIGVKYDFQYGRSRSDVDVHLEQYLEVPVFFKYYIRNSSSEPVASLFVGPSLSLNLSSVYKDKQEMINGTTILEEMFLLRDNESRLHAVHRLNPAQQHEDIAQLFLLLDGNFHTDMRVQTWILHSPGQLLFDTRIQPLFHDEVRP